MNRPVIRGFSLISLCSVSCISPVIWFLPIVPQDSSLFLLKPVVKSVWFLSPFLGVRNPVSDSILGTQGFKNMNVTVAVLTSNSG